MRQLNFTIIFIITLALVMFALQNTTSAPIQVFPNAKLEAPIAVELILAMGLGAVVAWLFSVWSGMQRMIDMRTKNQQIQNLQEQVTELSVEVEQRKRLSQAIDVEVEDKTKEA